MSAGPRARRPKLLVVDDGDRYVELCHALLRDYDYATRCELPGPCWTCERRPGCTLTHAHDAAETDEALARNRDVDVVLLDVAFDVPVERLLPSSEKSLERRRRLQGIEILAHLRRSRADLPVVLMTSEDELAYQDAAEALAVDEFASLAGEAAFDARALSLLVERVLARHADSPEAGGYTWGGSPAMARLRRDAHALARTSLPILVLGEPGTGKSALAERVLHPLARRKGPFVAVDLASIPDTLVAAELFGTARGAFSGAVDRRGRFEEANGGTLFLDEIGNLPPEAQRMLLLALQDQRITRLGESTPRSVDVKLVAATNADLGARVRAGTFRADLYARLNPAARLTMPPLREREGDLELLARALLKKKLAAGADRELLADYLDAAGLSGLPHAELFFGAPPRTLERGVALVLAKSSLAELRRHAFPGNVRELELLVANAAVFTLADALTAAREGRTQGAASARILPIPEKLVRDLLAAGSPAPVRAARAPGHAELEVRASKTLHAVALHLERQLYERLFAETGGDFDAMASQLLDEPGPTGARKVRLRFNQLGLKARRPKRRVDES
ncbi:MAG: sigma 54-interacting transcriptional regulator [Sandaracinus sp.]